MRRAVTVWCMLLVFGLSVSGGIVEAGFLHGPADHMTGDHGECAQLHSKRFMILHALDHYRALGDRMVLSGGHCCCFGPSPVEACQVPHVVRAPNVQKASRIVLDACSALRQAGPQILFGTLCNPRGSPANNPNNLLQHITCIVLLT